MQDFLTQLQPWYPSIGAFCFFTILRYVYKHFLQEISMRRNMPAWLLLAAAAVLILIGIQEGQPAQVLMKAIRVCMECVGIG